MSATSEMTSPRLQMAMDRRSKFAETLSNVIKIDSSQATGRCVDVRRPLSGCQLRRF
jgi:hypothetical protein